ncbi:hypothetical protein H072_5265 [Dactylellina haptotyla CBS 200.50]|uniref:Uncharacterized protein n=1 Tax=Dactylellina haptotyla (strain CBS 200.50) TaxID=1284197 RepID=S8AD41_DACHA|nr:hypothetical protein H072_5265 [Dactylellina haptotyla CBS 200.50]
MNRSHAVSEKHACVMDEPTQNPRSYKRQKHGKTTDDEETDSGSSRAETPPSLVAQAAAAGSSKTSSSMAEKSTGTTNLVPVKRNAFAELMAKKPKPPPEPAKPPKSSTSYFLNNDPRSGLAVYLKDPTSCPPGTILFYNDDFVVIKDAFPKATVHALILPRDIAITHLQPIEVLNSNPTLLASLREIANQTRDLLVKELQRIHRNSSKTEQIREKAFEALERRAISEPGFDPDSDEAMATLPPHRDWASTLKIGVHARPSMSNLHIHIISEDMHSPAMKRRVHFNSFNSKFFVNLDEFPLDKDDVRIPGVSKGATNLFIKGDMVCWRCKRNFKNQFKQLKEHLEMEYDAWSTV